MKHLLCILALFAFTIGAAQELEIQVLDAHTALPISEAWVSIQQDGDSLSGISNKKGWVKLPATKLDGQLKVRHISYLPYQTNISNPQRSLLNIYLSPRQNPLEEVVVTGQVKPTLSREAVHAVKVIDRKRIDQQAAVNLKDLLTQSLNFRLTEDAVLGSQINLQGLSGSKVKILVDGVPVIGRLDGNIDLGQINLNDIERVEVVEGPMAVQYGTDAMAGAINLITNRKATGKPEINANGYVESVGRYNMDASLQLPLGKWHTRLTLGRNFFDGYDANPNARNLQWNPKTQYFGSLATQRRFNKLLLRYRADYFWEQIANRGEIGSIDSLIVPGDSGAWKQPRALDDYYTTQRLNNALYADYYLNSDITLRAFVAYNYFQREKQSLLKNLSTGNEQFFTGEDAQDTSVFGLISSRLFFEHQLFPKKLSYQLGYDFNHELNQGQRIEAGEKSITDAALFASLHYRPHQKISLQPGLRYAYNSRFEAPLIFSLAARWELHSNWILRASYGQGFRAPSLKELYFLFVDENHNILGNTDLKAETSNNWQLGLQYNRNWKNTALILEGNAFFNDIQNEIRLVSVLDPSDDDPRGLYTNQNIARTQTSGGSLNGRFHWKSLETDAGISLIGLRNNLAFGDQASATGKSSFNFYPQYQFSAAYELKKLGLRPSLLLNHTGERKDLTLNAENELALTSYSPYTFLDFNLQKSLWKKHLQLTIGVKNLLDTQNLQLSTPAAQGAHSSGSSSIPLSYGRTYFARLQFNWQ